MCGLSFSGKTTLAQGIARFLAAEYVSLDVCLDGYERYSAVAARHAAQFVLVYVSVALSEIERARHNETAAWRHPILPEVFDKHARSFEHPTADEQPLVYDRSLPAEDWISAHFSRGC